MIKAPGKNIPKPDLADWRVFVQSKHYGSRHLTCKSLVLYEVTIKLSLHSEVSLILLSHIFSHLYLMRKNSRKSHSRVLHVVVTLSCIQSTRIINLQIF